MDINHLPKFKIFKSFFIWRLMPENLLLWGRRFFMILNFDC